MACYLCSAACPVDCIALQQRKINMAAVTVIFRINFHAVLFCGSARKRVPPMQSSLPRIRNGRIDRKNLVYEKRIVDRRPGNILTITSPMAGLAIKDKDKGEARTRLHLWIRIAVLPESEADLEV